MYSKAEIKELLKKLSISIVVLAVIIVGLYFLLRRFGLTDLSREQLQDYISSKGIIAPLIYIGVTFLQVTVIPIPGMITVLAGNYLFGPWLAFLYSYIGMLLGSMVSFCLGRALGRRFVDWIAGGSDKVDGWIKKLKGRENVLFFFMFLLPVFPDDVLCAVAGLFPMSAFTFLCMQLFTRITSIAATIIFMSGEIIPYHGWGLIVMSVGVVALIALFIVCFKYADKINDFFNSLVNKIARKNKIKGENNMDFLKLAKDRYSVRKFTDKPLEQEVIDKILKAGHLAPTGCNNQPQRILVLNTAESVEKLKDITRCHFNAPTAMLICYNKSECWTRRYDGKTCGVVDAAIVTTHMMLMAHTLGVGTTWVMSFNPTKMREAYSIPENVDPVALLVMGYPAPDAVPMNLHDEYRPIEETVFYDKF